MTCSHLNPEDAADVGVYLQHSGLLQLSEGEGVNQLLVWREVWPTRLCHEVAAINNVFGYSEPHARWFLMVVGGVGFLAIVVFSAHTHAKTYARMHAHSHAYMHRDKRKYTQTFTHINAHANIYM